MSTLSRSLRIAGLALPPLAVAGGLAYLRTVFQRRHVFVPDRFPNGIWDPRPFGLPIEDVWFEAPDAVQLHGWWIPVRRARGTILYCHGNTGSIAHQVGSLKQLRRLRCNVLAFDYRGYGRSDGRPSEEGVYRDVRAAYDHLVDERDADPRSILLFGHSLGARSRSTAPPTDRSPA